ncbi:MAG TPA: protocatechuate 3,4-dioxygenase subunit alpha [Geminicoccaceae bacterium]|jgi:protocatechuate 3,4-dioxygenase alpha subunit|nr:protocatechuate 3,4-dioxygenase subunit alpha [Geminicoccaceae bacterium]
MRLKQTPSQTVGPFFAYGLTPEQYGYPFRSLAGPILVDSDTPGERIRITGRVLDGEGNPVPDAMIEIWQANAEGRYAHPADQRGSNVRFKGFGRCGTGTDPENRFAFETIKPGPIGDGQAPHVNVIVFMRGMLSHVYTRIYFADEGEANAHDRVLASIDEARRDTLIAAREMTPGGAVYRFDLHMQGPDETVFFDV